MCIHGMHSELIHVYMMQYESMYIYKMYMEVWYMFIHSNKHWQNVHGQGTQLTAQPDSVNTSHLLHPFSSIHTCSGHFHCLSLFRLD